MYGEDLDLGLRLRLAGQGVGIVPAARADHDYAFVKGDYKWFHLERNRWWTMLGAYPAPLLALVLPALLAFEVALLRRGPARRLAAAQAARAARRRARAAGDPAPPPHRPGLARDQRAGVRRRPDRVARLARHRRGLVVALARGAAAGLLARGAGGPAMRVLWLTPELPFAPGGTGGSTRQFHLIRVARSSAATTWTSSRRCTPRRRPERTCCAAPGATLLRRPPARPRGCARRSRRSGGARRSRSTCCACPSSPGRSRCSARRCGRRCCAALDRAPDVIVVEHDWAARWVERLPAGVPCALGLQNLSWRYYESRAAAAGGRLGAAALRLEARRFAAFDRRLARALRGADDDVARRLRGAARRPGPRRRPSSPTASTRRRSSRARSRARRSRSSPGPSATRPTPRRSTGCCRTSGRACSPAARTRACSSWGATSRRGWRRSPVRA